MIAVVLPVCVSGGCSERANDEVRMVRGCSCGRWWQNRKGWWWKKGAGGKWKVTLEKHTEQEPEGALVLARALPLGASLGIRLGRREFTPVFLRHK